ncbi:hypothetical protein ACTID9_13955 [Brevibacillus fluminis]|uniref:hypothetical protein n=1 Tax=Brevibacillus fluminis TaxID=511487 RepID=UPI003F8CF188
MRVLGHLGFACLLVISLLQCQVAWAQRPDIAKLQLDTTPAANARQLAQKSTLIVSASANSSFQSFPTGKKIGAYQVVNYIQTLQVNSVIKGASPRLIRLLSVGIEPLPDAKDPLNDKYPGPLAEGNYVFFLHPVRGTGFYSLTGLWQGVYPLLDGKTISLKKTGFAEYDGLNVEQLKQRVR